MKRFVVVAALGTGLAMSTWAVADTEIETFDNFNLNQLYANWAAPSTIITSGPTSFGVQATGYGSGYKSLGPPTDASAENTVQLDATVDAGVAGFVLDISDSSDNGEQWAWYGLTPGGGINGGNEYLLTLPVSSGTFFLGTGVLDLTHISQLNIGVDPGAFASTPYNVSFNDLSFTSTPEPAALCTVAIGLAWVARRRRCGAPVTIESD